MVLAGTRYCHASPISDVRSFLPEPAEDEPELLDGATERRLIFGHTHQAAAAAVRERFGAAEWTETVARRIENARM